jgi:8-oxo-dGTP pyrophosphatase MutT (NUDIX family)
MNTLRENLPHATVAIVIEQDNRFLLVHEFCDGRWVYNQPAGHIESGESVTEAAIREAREETAWDIKPTAIGGLSVYHAPNGITYLRTTLIAETTHFHPEQPLDDGIKEAVWLTYEDILDKKNSLRSPIVLKVIEDYRAGIRYPLALIYEHR